MNAHFLETFFNGQTDYLHKHLGSHLIKNERGEIVATEFLVYAPHAKRVFLIADFNHFSEANEMEKISHLGFFYLRFNHSLEWSMYKYKIYDKDGNVHVKNDPFGYFHEVRPATATKVYNIDDYHWNDSKWIYEKKKPYQKPLLIYEMHLGSWQQKFGTFKNYNELADDLIAYLKKHSFTHVEFLPVYEHPLDDSWGYQGTNFFAATSRYGSPKDLMYLIDRLHQAGIGVLIDWVLGHICKDSHGLFKFDGSYLYEYDDNLRRENLDWGTANLDFSKGITRSFMKSALTFWMDYFHVDGFRIDAVSRLIYYLGDPNKGTNQEAIRFLRELGLHLFHKDDRILFMAEDSTDYAKVTHPVSEGGLGFNYKWNMGFMNDTLSYFKDDPIYRKYNHHKITFGMHYAYSENFILPYSHDEVVHMKGSLLNKMPGSLENKLSQWRILMTLFMTHPGKKLLFMGSEFAQRKEWNFRTEIEWELLAFEEHQKANKYFIDLARLYKNNTPFYKFDHESRGFEWLVVDDKDQSVFAYMRKSNRAAYVVVLNMTPNYHEFYRIGVPFKGEYTEVLNSNYSIYGGWLDVSKPQVLESIDEQELGFSQHIRPTITPFSAMIFKLQKK